jgi:regulatory protein
MKNDLAYKENDHPEELDLAQAKKLVINWISRRDYSEFELKQKLERIAPPGTMNEVISWCHQQKLILSPEVMTEMVIQKFDRQKKGIEQINHQLRKMGLVEILEDTSIELEKSTQLIFKKIGQILRTKPWSSLDFEEKQMVKAKVFRFLATRGFSSEIIESSYDQWIKNNKDMDDNECD